MAIVAIPSGIRADEPISCVICGRDMPLDALTPGLTDATGKQQFACYGHSWDSGKFVVGWALFAIEQRRILTQTALQMGYGEELRHGRRIR